jgi:hypothetical protein
LVEAHDADQRVRDACPDACPLHRLSFDPAVVWAQDIAIERGTLDPIFVYDGWRADVRRWPVVWSWRGRDEGFAAYIAGLRDLLLLPLVEPFRAALEDVWDMADAERYRREAARRRALKGDWATADLVAEVAAVCGEGRDRGGEWWFSCPWHSDSDPSLHVDARARVWHAFCCGRGGGVIAWRRAWSE